MALGGAQVAGGHGSPDARGDAPGHRHTPGCWAVAKSGIPPREPLFNATICRFPGQWGAEASARAFSFGSDGGIVPLEVTLSLVTGKGSLLGEGMPGAGQTHGKGNRYGKVAVAFSACGMMCKLQGVESTATLPYHCNYACAALTCVWHQGLGL